MKRSIITLSVLLISVKLFAQTPDAHMHGYKGKIKEVRMFEGEGSSFGNKIEDSSQGTLTVIKFDENGNMLSEEEFSYKHDIRAKRLYKYENGVKTYDELYMDDRLVITRSYAQQTPYIIAVEVKDARGKLQSRGTIELDKSFRLHKTTYGSQSTQYDYLEDGDRALTTTTNGKISGSMLMTMEKDKYGNPTATRIMDEVHVLNPLLRLSAYTYYQ